MIRRLAAAVFLLVVTPAALVSAQDTVLSVSVPSAEVHKGPSTATPVVGRAARGTNLPVAQNLGSWVKVSWPDAADGVGYVHVTMGRVGPPPAVRPVARGVAAAAGAPSGPAPANSAPAAPDATSRSAELQAMPLSPSQPPIAPVAGRRSHVPHAFGLGGLVASPRAFGASARFWGNKHLGVQLGFTRDTMTSEFLPGRVTSMQFEPGFIYAPRDHVTDYVWLRPYVGSVASFRRQTLSGAALAVEPATESGVGFRAFGGGELMFSNLPRFGVSIEVGYRRLPTLFDGFEADRVSASIVGHWYVK